MTITSHELKTYSITMYAGKNNCVTRHVKGGYTGVVEGFEKNDRGFWFPLTEILYDKTNA